MLSSKADFGILKLLESERLVPHRCGHGCCDMSSNVPNVQKSLLGPEFVDYAEPPSFPSHELAALATDISNIAWSRSGLDNQSHDQLGNKTRLTGTSDSWRSSAQPANVGSLG